MTVPLREPKRKHWGSVAEVVPFPIHTEKATGVPVCEATRQTYTGRYDGDSVIVKNLEDIWSLYTMGCFGKGSLSRGCSLLGRAKKKHPQFIKESQWRRHKKWQELASIKKETEKVSKSPEKISKSPEKPKEQDSNNSNCDKKIDEKKADDKSNEESGSKDLNVTVLDDAASEGSDIVEVENSGDVENSAKRKLDSESPGTPRKRRSLAAGEYKVRNPAAEEPKVRNPAADKSKNQNSAAEASKTQNSPAEKPADTSNIEIVDLSSDEESLCSDQEESGNVSALQSSKAGGSSRKSGAESRDCERTEVVVLAGGDSDDEDYFTNLKPRLEHEPAELTQEKLILSLEEALFLSYGLGCLRILGLGGEELSLEDIWRLFQGSQRSFVQRYVVYHYFRSKGWVVKSGLKYGGDFALYKEGPQRYHSTYVVIVQVVKEGTSARDPARDRRPMSWTQLMGLTRLLESVGKEVILCQVIWPDNLQTRILPSPQVLSSFRVQETLLKRWVPSQDREGTTTLKGREGNLPENTAELACA